ncbi:MAG: bifunctional glutamine-synthetase adenylyltransferase/deadenyltransferase, partial [Actinobacteria bacterium]|nr:bifunctional glutamine-synthetase adenylyltransferase/deadenyltransferase [Actinomycetota bacterium]
MSRSATTSGHLVRLGFHDPRASLEVLAELGDEVADPLVALMGRTADPDQAVAGLLRLARVVDDRGEMLRAVSDDEGTAMRLLSVLGASAALSDHLVRHPAHWREL